MSKEGLNGLQIHSIFNIVIVFIGYLCTALAAIENGAKRYYNSAAKTKIK